MVFFNWATMQMAAKIVYYGPGLCGKTSNLSYIYAKTSPTSRGEMVSLETESDRTLFFDLLPIEVGTIGGFKTRLQLYTVPGQVFYNTTRKLVLKGVDGLVFVADSQRPMREANIESFRSLTENIEELGLEIGDLPLVLQYNKRDLQNILAEEELDSDLNPTGELVSHPASAINGDGVFETLKEITKLTLRKLRLRMASPQAETTARPPTPKPTPAPTNHGEQRRAISAASLARAAEEGVVGENSDVPDSSPLTAASSPQETGDSTDLSGVSSSDPSTEPVSEVQEQSADEALNEPQPDRPDASVEAAPDTTSPDKNDDAAPSQDEETAPPGTSFTRQAGSEDETEADSEGTAEESWDDELSDGDEVTPARGIELPKDEDTIADRNSEAEADEEEIEVLEVEESDTATATSPAEDIESPSPEETTAPSLPELEPEETSFDSDEPESSEEDGSPGLSEEAPVLDGEEVEVEFDTSADKEVDSIPPPMKRVQISNQTDILAELDGLRREATEAPSSRSRHSVKTPDLDLDALLSGGSPRTRDLKRRIEQSLNSNIFSQMRTIQLAFDIQDEDGSTIHSLEPISLPLDDVSALEKLVLQLTVDLENVK